MSFFFCHCCHSVRYFLWWSDLVRNEKKKTPGGRVVQVQKTVHLPRKTTGGIALRGKIKKKISLVRGKSSL